MIEVELSRAAEELLEKLYSVYKQRADSGWDIDRAVCFGSSKTIQNELLSDWTHDEVIAACWTLYDADMMNFLPLDGQPDEIYLRDRAIIYGEQAKERKRSKLKNTVSWLRDLLPF